MRPERVQIQGSPGPLNCLRAIYQMPRPFALLATAVLCACAPIPLTTQPSVPSAASTFPMPALVAAAERWIEVDLGASEVILHSDEADPVHLGAATGIAGDPAYGTPVGLFHVQSMQEGPIENVPGVFVSFILIVDIGSGTGIHSLPVDSQGNVLDDRLAPSVTAGCVRVAEAAVTYEFAELGMPVWIH